jgi:hypothetical protein
MSADFDVKKLIETILVKKEKEESFIDFYSIQPNESFESSTRRNKFSKDLVLPIGKRGNSVMNITLD